MRLLEWSGADGLSLTKDFVGDNIPEYAILSHTWGADTEEVTYNDLRDGTGMDKVGYQKIHFCGEQAKRDNLHYFWVDTCCIDKSNSTELGEAINSMFRWYQKAARCYVYLSDVSTSDPDQDESWLSAFQNSSWFTRGWTLQELIAPSSVEFFCSNGRRLGDKNSLEKEIQEITGIAIEALQGSDPSGFSIEERMGWAESRNTTRGEDKAYSLLGIFGVHMPLIYGEGPEEALLRLREVVCKCQKRKNHDDSSAISQASSGSRKRLKTSESQTSLNRSFRDKNSLDSQPSMCSENSFQSGDKLPENQKEPSTTVCHGIDAATKQSIIDLLYFDKIDERLIGLAAAQGKTCRWFLTKPEYQSWQDAKQQQDHGGFLWIKGHPGTGKSTLMKLLFEETKLTTKTDLSQITISFFFRARGTVEEKSTTGLYRSLLHQLLEKAVDLRDSSVDWITSDGARIIQRNGWHEEALKHTLTHAIQQLNNRSLTIFIDALDECNKTQAADMVCFFEELCDRASEAHVRLQICFSSRHYPTITIEKGIEVVLESEIGHTEDIQQYIKSKLRVGRTKQVESLRSEILERSSRIFLWVVLVLDILNSEYANGSLTTKQIHRRLKQIPPKLSDLFGMILTRDAENFEELQLCLKWVLFAARPLKAPELYFAIQFGLERESPGLWDPEDVSLDLMETFVRSSSKGLAEVTRTKASEVQFIHESVRHYLLDKYESQWSETPSNFIGHCHQVLRDCCLAQLNGSEYRDVCLPKAVSKALEKDLRGEISSKFPFLEYSSLNMLYHANIAQQNAVQQADFLADFPLKQWIAINNTFEIYEIRRYTKSATLLYILADRNCAALIRIYPERECCFEVENEHYGLPMFAALSTGNLEVVQTFLEIQAESQPEMPLLRDLCKLRSKNNNDTHTNFPRNFTFSRQRGVFSQFMHDEVMCTFFCASRSFNTESDTDAWGRTPLSHAASRSSEAIVKLLLERGANLEARDTAEQRTPLLWAIIGLEERRIHVREAIIKLLVEKGAKLEVKDKGYRRTPLIWAVTRGQEATVKLFLEKGAQTKVIDKGWGRTPLHWAADYEYTGIVKLLLDKGADMHVVDDMGETPLEIARRGGNEELAKLLLEWPKST